MPADIICNVPPPVTKSTIFFINFVLRMSNVLRACIFLHLLAYQHFWKICPFEKLLVILAICYLQRMG